MPGRHIQLQVRKPRWLHVRAATRIADLLVQSKTSWPVFACMHDKNTCNYTTIYIHVDEQAHVRYNTQVIRHSYLAQISTQCDAVLCTKMQEVVSQQFMHVCQCSSRRADARL